MPRREWKMDEQDLIIPDVSGKQFLMEMKETSLTEN